MANLPLSSVVTGASGLLGSIVSSIGSNRAVKKQIDYNKWAQLNQQQFNALEAQKARDYQTEFYEQYQSPSAMVKQYQEAGLNPALAYNGAINTPPSATSATSGMSSISPQNTLQSFEQLGGLIGNMFKLKSEIDNINADTNLKNEQAGNTAQDTLLKGETLNLTKAQGKKLEYEINQIVANTNLTNEQRDLVAQQIISTSLKNSLDGYQVTINGLYEKLRKDLKLPVPVTDTLVSAVVHASVGVVGNFASSFGNIAKLLFGGKSKLPKSPELKLRSKSQSSYSPGSSVDWY